MSLDNCSVKVIKEFETNHVSPFLTFLSETWNCFLPPNMGKRSFGTRHESESIALKQIFLMLNGVVSYEQLRKSVTKWTLLVKKVQYNVFLILEGRLKN